MSKAEEKELGGLQKEAKKAVIVQLQQKEGCEGSLEDCSAERYHEMEWYGLRFKTNDVAG